MSKTPTFSTVLIDPTPEALEACVVQAQEHANSKARTRTVTGLTGVDAFNAAEGSSEFDGGGVANRYGYGAGTSAVGYAWFTDDAGRRHVRVCGMRMEIRGRDVPCLFGSTRGHVKPVVDVYPDLHHAFTKTDAKRLPKLGRALDEACRENPADAASRGAFADWLEENGYAHQAKAERSAAAQAARLLEKVNA